tara:strand:- start:85 stop:1128 length:1044 start_codon:yes stop_codon:yes gene_type:complete
MALERTIGKNNKVFWRRVSLDLFDIPVIPITDESIEAPEGHKEIVDFIHGSYSLKPKGLAMAELKWKYLVRSAVRGKNILMTGPAGCGKTMAAKSLVHALDRPDFYFNLGATQDPRSTLIGNTHFDNETGTYFSKALFVKAISTPNAIILLDELSRAHPDAWNILMTVLDEGQRYLRLDEADGSETINVAEGVTFVATANIGNEYTSTRVMDKALMDRFIIVEMDVLDAEEEHGLLKYMFPHINDELLQPVAEIAHLTRIESLSESGKITSGVSTRTSVEVSGLLFDGFKLAHAAEVCIYPQYSNDGGVESERTYIKQLVQKYISDGSSDDLFNEDEIQRSNEGTSS